MKNHHTITLRTKLILILTLALLLPMIAFSLGLLFIYSHTTESTILQNQTDSTMQLADRISQELNNISSTSNLYYLDKQLAEYLSEASLNETEELDAYVASIANQYASHISSYHAVVTVYDRYFQAHSSTVLQNAPTPQQLVAITKRSGNLNWFTSYDLGGDSSNTMLYAYRPLHDFSDWHEIGSLLIAMKENDLRKIYAGYLSETQNAYLLDQYGNVISCVENQQISYTPNSSTLSLFSGNFKETIDGVPQLTTFYTINTANLQLVIVSNLNALRQPQLQMTQVFLLILIVFFLLMLVVVIVFPSKFVKPIRTLSRNIDLVKSGNFDATVPVTSNDEIGQLTQQYNEMLLRVKNLLKEIVDAQESQHQAEIHALQAQINPHFIYNTLASIRFLVFAGENQRADAALLSLVAILRGTLSNPHELSSVGQELNLLKDYIEIQKISFSQELTVSFEIDEQVRSVPLCKLTLQPIAENCFIHGFAGGQKDCQIHVSAKDMGEIVIISITDNGQGFDPDMPREPSHFNAHNGIGTNNVDERLKLTFGRSYGLQTTSTVGKGTTVTVTIPKAKKEGGAIVYDNSDC